MAIPVTPLHIAVDELEIQMPRESGVLPDMVLRLEGPKQAPAYAEVLSVDIQADTLQVRLGLLYGQAGLSIDSARILSDEALAHEIPRLFEDDARQPVTLVDGVTLDLSRMGSLTVLAGEPFDAKFEVMLALAGGLARYRKLLIVDPLGLFEEEDGVLVLRAGEDVRLSIQSMGIQRFLQSVAATLPEPVQGDALQLLMQQLPISPDFIPFKRFLNLERAEHDPVRTALLYNLYELYGQRIFADEPDEQLDLGAIENQVTVLDLSGVPESWKTLFYEQVMREWLLETEADVLPVLIYPEQYLTSVSEWIPPVEAQGLNLLAMVSPYEAEDEAPLPVLADNWLDVREEGCLEIRGRMTQQLPLRVPLFSLLQHAAQHGAPPDVEMVEAPPFPDAEAADAFRFSLNEDEEPGPVATPEEFGIRPATPPAEPSPEAARPEPTWESLGWRPVMDAPDVVASSTEAASPEAPLYDSILGDVRELEAAPPQPPNPPAEPVAPASQASSSLTEGDEELDFAFEDWQDASAEEELELSAEGFVSGFPDEAPVSAAFTEEPSEAAPVWAEPLPVQDEVPVYQTRQLPQPTLGADDFQVGERVRHPKHGVGVIQKKIPMDTGVILNIQFESMGKCLVDPRLAPLEKV